jgi:hypothetical protein
MLHSVGLMSIQLQLLKSLDDRVEANGGWRLDERDSLHQLSLHGEDEVQTLEAPCAPKV